MKKHVQRVLLPLLFSCCFVFSGFLSVNAFASSSDVSFVVEVHNYPEDSNIHYGSSSVQIDTSEAKTPQLIFDVVIPRTVLLTNTSGYYDFMFVLHHTVEGNLNLKAEFYDYNNNLLATRYRNSNISVQTASTMYVSTGDIENDHTIGRVHFTVTWPTSTATYSETLLMTVQAVVVGDTTTESIIAAINNQTGVLQGSIGQAADDIQQSIEDQYSGTPEDQLDIDSVITQHNDKMGVLSFGSDVMLQFLGMFQSANVGAAQLTLPGFAITVENQEHQVWPDYSFNFEQLNEWVPGLMSVIRMMLPAFVWLMVLRYIVNVFEKNFLSNGG